MGLRLCEDVAGRVIMCLCVSQVPTPSGSPAPHSVATEFPRPGPHDVPIEAHSGGRAPDPRITNDDQSGKAARSCRRIIANKVMEICVFRDPTFAAGRRSRESGRAHAVQCVGRGDERGSGLIGGGGIGRPLRRGWGGELQESSAHHAHHCPLLRSGQCWPQVRT